MITSQTKLSDLVEGDKVFCGLEIYPVKRITPKGRIVTMHKSIAGMDYEKMWRKDGTGVDNDEWYTKSIRPLTEKDRARILAARSREIMTSILSGKSWEAFTNSQLDQVLVLIESFDGDK